MLILDACYATEDANGLTTCHVVLSGKDYKMEMPDASTEVLTSCIGNLRKHIGKGVNMFAVATNGSVLDVGGALFGAGVFFDDYMCTEKVNQAIALAINYKGIDESHHKDWVIDQMVRILAGDKYDQIVAYSCRGSDGPATYSWDVGIAP